MELRIGANYDEQTLQVRYIFTNTTATDVFVQHYVVQHPEAKPSCYVYHLRPQNEVVLWAGTPPIPPWMCFAQPPKALAEQLPPGDSCDVLLRLPLPLVETGVWNGPEPDGPLESVSANLIRFRLDVLPKRRGLDIRHVKREPGLLRVGGAAPQVLEATTTIDPPFIVRRRGKFHRGGLDPMDTQFTPW